MNKIILSSALTLVAAAVSSCSLPMRQPLTGFLYSDTQATENVTYLSNASRTGKACMQSILGVTTGDASMDAAKREGHITQVAYFDNTNQSVLGVWAQYCLVVHGR